MSDALHTRMLPFSSAAGQHLFAVAGSRIFDIDAATAAAVDRALRLDDERQLPTALRSLLRQPQAPSQAPPAPPAVTALSLNLVQACNMGCTYCYAEQGSFGGAPKAMSAEIARASVDRLLQHAPPGRRVIIAFMGGEPFLARHLLRDVTRYAWSQAQRSGRQVDFALTTNASLIEDDDAALLADHPFSVTVSIDGPPAIQDRQRPMRNGAPSSGRLQQGLARLLSRRPRELTARMSVTADTGPLLPILDYALSLGFDSAGFAPIVAAPQRRGELVGDALQRYTAAVIACGRHALGELKAGRAYPFSNFAAAMLELHRGSARAHPCGAGAGYLSIDAAGEAFACHRLVGNEAFHYGSLAAGIDDAARLAHLRDRAVDRQEPCRSCWARYLCGGGCYHEVSLRGRTACDHIRGWLAFCLEAYAELSAARPELFDRPPEAGALAEFIPAADRG
jgi:uncharacterized protein